MKGQEVARIGGIRFQFLAQPENMIVHGARGRIILVAPYFVEQFVSRKNPTGRRGKELQELT